MFPRSETRKVPGTNAFVPQLLAILKHVDPAIIEWSLDGRIILVKNTVKLAMEVLPTYFKTNNYASFVRQLNYYGFQKIKKDGHDGFQHETFSRDNPNASCIRRMTTEDNLQIRCSALELELRKTKNELRRVQQELLALQAPIVRVSSKRGREESLTTPAKRFTNTSYDKEEAAVSVKSSGSSTEGSSTDADIGSDLDWLDVLLCDFHGGLIPV